MINKTTIKIPKKYSLMLEELTVEQIGFSEKEYTAYAREGYYFSDTECHIGTGNTQAEILQDIRSLQKCSCIECSPYWNNQ